MKNTLRLTESDLVRLIRKVINEQQYDTRPTTNGTSRYKYTRSNPLKIPKDPYIYAYEGPGLLFVKNIERGDTEWIDIDKTNRAVTKKFIYSVCDKYGYLLGMQCANRQGEKLPKYIGPHN